MEPAFPDPVSFAISTCNRKDLRQIASTYKGNRQSVQIKIWNIEVNLRETHEASLLLDLPQGKTNYRKHRILRREGKKPRKAPSRIRRVEVDRY